MSINALCLFISILFLQEQVPYKPASEFQVNIDVKFKEKTAGNNDPTNVYTSNGERLDKNTLGLRAFLSVSISQLIITSAEMKILAVNSDGKKLLNKKTSPVPELEFKMGFVEDLKNGTAPREITVYFLSGEKKELSKIVFGVLPDGVFQVNGQWHGQF